MNPSHWMIKPSIECTTYVLVRSAGQKEFQLVVPGRSIAYSRDGFNKLVSVEFAAFIQGIDDTDSVLLRSNTYECAPHLYKGLDKLRPLNFILLNNAVGQKRVIRDK